jgi:hypothetical protein
MNCTGPGLFSCDDSEKTCILAEFQCDGYKDCPNNLDEENCLSETALESVQETCSKENMRNLAVCRPENYEGNCANDITGTDMCDGVWKCRYGYDEAGCTTEVAENQCGIPDPEPRFNPSLMGWATGRAKFLNVDNKWAWTGVLNYNGKFQCSVHMVAEDWYLSSLECIKKGLTRTKQSSSWFRYGGCSISEEIKIKHSIDPQGYTIQHRNVYGKGVDYIVKRVILHPDEDEIEDEKNRMVLINSINNSENQIRRPICFTSIETQQFNFELDRPHLCQIVGHRSNNNNFSKWQMLAPVSKIEETLWAGYRMLLVQPFQDDPGAGLICQSWDQRWHLVGILQHSKNYDKNWPTVRAGLNFFNDVQHLSTWVQQDCPGQFLCQIEEKCILLENVCDGKIDCSDGTDENNCVSGKLPKIYQKQSVTPYHGNF